MDGLSQIGNFIPKGTSEFKLTVLVKGSIENEEDTRNTEGMHTMDAIHDYMRQRYMTSPYLLKATLSGLESKKIPKTKQQAADNIEATITMANLLVGVKLIDSLDNTHLAMLESRCIMSGMRRELYDDAQVRSRRDLLRIDPLRTSSPIGGL